VLEKLKHLDGQGKLNHIILVDLDNWTHFFPRLEKAQVNFPQGTFILGFHHRYANFKLPERREQGGYSVVRKLKDDPNGGINIRVCQKKKDAADFAICIRFGQLDQAMGILTPITILSGDKGFEELKQAPKRRKIYIVNPHDRSLLLDAQQQFSKDVLIWAKLVSISEQSSILESEKAKAAGNHSGTF